MKEEGKRVVLWGRQSDELGDLKATLERREFAVEWASSEDQVRNIIQKDGADLVIAPLHSGFESPLKLLRWSRGLVNPPPVLIVTGGNQVPLYLEAMERGAFDCIPLPVDENELMRIVGQALQSRYHTLVAEAGRR
jgi:two-component system response regulator HydG